MENSETISGFFHLVRRKKFQTHVKSVIVLEKIYNYHHNQFNKCFPFTLNFLILYISDQVL